MRTLYHTDANPKNVVGWCGFHRKWLTRNQLKKHKCLCKQCNALRKIPNPYWEHREKIKALKKAKKNDISRNQGTPSKEADSGQALV